MTLFATHRAGSDVLLTHRPDLVALASCSLLSAGFTLIVVGSCTRLGHAFP